MPDKKFNGFPKALPNFLGDLAANNNREWFEANKPQYQKLLVEPALDFIEAMVPLVTTMSPALNAQARLNGSLRRIHRDVRFSKDKTPYTPRLHLIFWSGSHPNRSPACHVVLGPDYFGFGAGQWGFDKTQLERYRTNLMKKSVMRQLCDALETAGQDKQFLEEPALKRVPDNIEADGQLALLLRHKGIVVRNQSEPYDKRIFTSECSQFIFERMGRVAPLNNWLIKYVN